MSMLLCVCAREVRRLGARKKKSYSVEKFLRCNLLCVKRLLFVKLLCVCVRQFFLILGVEDSVKMFVCEKACCVKVC